MLQYVILDRTAVLEAYFLFHTKLELLVHAGHSQRYADRWTLTDATTIAVPAFAQGGILQHPL